MLLFHIYTILKKQREQLKHVKPFPRNKGLGPVKADYYRVVMTKKKNIEMSKSESWIVLQKENMFGIENPDKIIKFDGVDKISIDLNYLSWLLGLENK